MAKVFRCDGDVHEASCLANDLAVQVAGQGTPSGRLDR
jgi:hypothetical protein